MFIRFISHIFKLGYEPCKSCEMLQEQLQIERNENKQLMDTLLDMVKPKIHESPSVPIAPIRPKAMPWGIRRRQFEESARQEAQILRESQVMEGPRTVSPTTAELERNLGIEENASENDKTI